MEKEQLINILNRQGFEEPLVEEIITSGRLKKVKAAIEKRK